MAPLCSQSETLNTCPGFGFLGACASKEHSPRSEDHGSLLVPCYDANSCLSCLFHERAIHIHFDPATARFLPSFPYGPLVLSITETTGLLVQATTIRYQRLLPLPLGNHRNLTILHHKREGI
ncbi:hypothetical protein U9M48_021887 [Paspalum notatum var. saurae]|uniref:Uncharacterized protein n=1 Tax=Paspalum notatum var. saurae TaxID=547442 RepID=A0AAQ3WU57_PASNO